MRADRAYIAGLGTTSVLVASALLLLAVVSTLVAFRGWPGTGLAEDIGNLVVKDSPRSLPVEGPEQVARDAASAAAAVAGAPAPGTAAAAPARTAGRAEDRSRTATPPTVFRRGDGGGFRGERRVLTETPTRDPVTQPPRSAVALLPETPVSSEVERVTAGLGDTTQELTDGLGQTVGLVSPQLGVTLTDTGQALAELLRGLGQPRP